LPELISEWRSAEATCGSPKHRYPWLYHLQSSYATKDVCLLSYTETIACEWDGSPVDYARVIDELAVVDGLT
jgi:hypothetical protein